MQLRPNSYSYSRAGIYDDDPYLVAIGQQLRDFSGVDTESRERREVPEIIDEINYRVINAPEGSWT